MAMVNERGELFGRWNIVDALIALMVVVLIPLSYGAYLMFRTPMPTLSRVEPAVVTYGPNMQFKVKGQNLRPYLRVSLNNHQGKSFLFGDSTEAAVELLDVPPGVYDVVLYDQAQERDRLPKAFTIAPSALPDAQLVVVGTFGNLNPDQVKRIVTGMVIDGIGVVTAVGRAVPQVTRVFVRPGFVEIPIANAQMLPATLRLGCFVRSSYGQPECVAAGFSVQPSSLYFFDTPAGKVPFQVDQVLGLQPLESVYITVRVAGHRTVLDQIAVGDRDLGDVRNELSATGNVDAVSPAGDARDVRMTVQAQRGATSWTYAMSPLRLGSAFVLRTARYEVHGQVVALDPAHSGAK
jgi:hypothetical protein